MPDGLQSASDKVHLDESREVVRVCSEAGFAVSVYPICAGGYLVGGPVLAVWPQLCRAIACDPSATIEVHRPIRCSLCLHRMDCRLYNRCGKAG